VYVPEPKKYCLQLRETAFHDISVEGRVKMNVQLGIYHDRSKNAVRLKIKSMRWICGMVRVFSTLRKTKIFSKEISHNKVVDQVTN